ncbi:SMC-Scp complex subunit ScpB [Flammeovirga sp. SubArs3]|uniref:SMC-Scp complex subunit ScpB n=1 Tax=Flammeovirga sp. SubArs3 TaxID=2995316 RepID=UPI0032B2D078
MMDQTNIQSAIEAMIFISDEPISINEMIQVFDDIKEEGVEEEIVSKEDVLKAIDTLKRKYSHKNHSYELVQSGDGYCFMTKQKYSKIVNALLKNRSKKRLSKSALETLSIIAYRQPITKGEIEKIRGVGCDYAMKKLLSRELIKMKGKSDAIGRPMLYGTTDRFLEYFGINTLKDLPSPKEFKEEDLDPSLTDDQNTSTEQVTESEVTQ